MELLFNPDTTSANSTFNSCSAWSICGNLDYGNLTAFTNVTNELELPLPGPYIPAMGIYLADVSSVRLASDRTSQLICLDRTENQLPTLSVRLQALGPGGMRQFSVYPKLLAMM